MFHYFRTIQSIKMARSASNNLPASHRRRDTTNNPERPTPSLGGGPDSTEVCYFCFCTPCVEHEDIIPDFV